MQQEELTEEQLTEQYVMLHVMEMSKMQDDIQEEHMMHCAADHNMMARAINCRAHKLKDPLAP